MLIKEEISVVLFWQIIIVTALLKMQKHPAPCVLKMHGAGCFCVLKHMIINRNLSLNNFIDNGRSAGTIAIALPVAFGTPLERSGGSYVSRHATGGYPHPLWHAIDGGWRAGG